MKIVLLGAPGSGKGTLSEYLIEKYNFDHISTGNLFRKVIAENLKHVEELKTYLLSGALVPDDLTNKLAKEEIQTLEKQKKSFILDGYPRNIDQALFLDNLLTIDKVIYINVSEDSIIKRLTGRRTCSTCGKIYNIYYMPPKKDGVCDIDGGLLLQRKDDEEAVISNRLETYRKTTFPLVDFYRRQKKLIEIDGDSGKEKIRKEVDNILK